MLFSDIFSEDTVKLELENRHGVEFRLIPFDDCRGQTSYWISRDGRHVYVGVTFCGYTQCKEVKIYPPKYRSANSSASFKRRNNTGKQCYSTIPAAVYGAFICRDGMPRQKIRHRDGDVSNCSAENLFVGADVDITQNMQALKDIYQYHAEIALYIHRISKTPFADDIASDSFLRMCESRLPIDPTRALSLWVKLSRDRLFTHMRDNRTQPLDDDFFKFWVCENDYDNVIDLLDKLPEVLYDTVYLLSAGYNVREIAKLQNITAGGVRLRLKKASERLKNIAT